MIDVAVLIPVLARPHRVEDVLASLREAAASEYTHKVRPVFLCSPADGAQVRAVKRSGADHIVVPWLPGRGDYARKMSLGFKETSETWTLLAADDVVFHPGWLDACLAAHDATDACVIGTNDLGNQRTVAGRHSTHTLIHRDYGECGTIDDPSTILHLGYWHNFVDDELVGTAEWRGTYAHASGAVVEHLHPNWGKGVEDATYRRGQLHFDDDRRHHRRRAPMWGG